MCIIRFLLLTKETSGECISIKLSIAQSIHYYSNLTFVKQLFVYDCYPFLLLILHSLANFPVDNMPVSITWAHIPQENEAGYVQPYKATW